MRKMKILLTRSMLSSDIEYIKDSYTIKEPATFTEEVILKEAIDADVLLGPYVTKQILKNAKNLKLIQIPWTGMDTFNFEAVRGFAVPVCNTHSNADSVAEMGVSILLDLIKKISYHDRKMRYGNWNRNQEPLDLKSKMLSKQTVCILGCGAIGYKIAKLVFAFGANIIAVDEHRQPSEVVSEVYSSNDISIALSKATIVISSLPLTRSTRNMINSEIVSKMIDGVIIVNMSRSAVMDEDAIYEGLVSGKISGFGADVWWNTPRRGESESYPSTHNKFWCFDNVVMSPHRAGFVENCFPHLDGAIDNIVNLYRNKPLESLVDTVKNF
jgi:D-3-phosphoglycerate dehydrogenase